MFSLEEVQTIHDELTDGLAEYAQKLGRIGVKSYITYISDGHSVYFGADDAQLTSAAVHEAFPVSATSDPDGAQRALDRHAKNLTDYLTMSQELADSGVETWVVDTGKGTIAFCDVTGAVVFVESVDSE